MNYELPGGAKVG